MVSYCSNLSGGVALNVWFTMNEMCAKNNNIYRWRKQTIVREIARHDLYYCCLLPQCEALRICRSGFRSQQNGAVTRMWRSSQKEYAISAVHLKMRGYCCNLSIGVALIVWFTTNGMCTKNNNIYMWCEQAMIEYRSVITLFIIIACCEAFAYMPLGLSDHNTTR